MNKDGRSTNLQRSLTEYGGMILLLSCLLIDLDQRARLLHHRDGANSSVTGGRGHLNLVSFVVDKGDVLVTLRNVSGYCGVGGGLRRGNVNLDSLVV